MNTTNNNVQGLKYSGHITITYKKGNRVLKVEKYKNAGRWPLFYFLNNALKGDYSLADKWRPKFILLFNAADEGAQIPEINDTGVESNKIGSYANDNKKRSFTPILYSEDPVINKVENQGIGSGSLTYKFVIPFTHIDTSKGAINLIGIYSSEQISTKKYDEPSMYFFVSKINDAGDTVLGNINSVTSGNKDAEYNVFIEWTLNITNDKGEK